MAHIPKPFQRPGINLGGPKKEWHTVQAGQIEVEDLIKGRGLVQDVSKGEKTGTVRFFMASGLVIILHEMEEIEAFVKVSK